MPQVAEAPTKASQGPKRIVPLTRTLKKQTNKIDTADRIKNWKIKTDIIKIIKAIKGKMPWVQVIDPDMAMDLLTLNDRHHNRPLTWKKINEYIEEMKAGEWGQYNGDTIRISTDIQLLDGQNRLWACVLSGVNLEVIIAPNIDPKMFSKMDRGENRTAAHMATICGWGTNPNQAAHTVKNILLYKSTGQIKGSVSDKHIPNFKVSNFMENKRVMEKLIDDLGWAKAEWVHKTGKWFTAPQWATIFYILRDNPGMEVEARKFLDKFALGSGYHEKSPIRQARRHFETEFKHLLVGKKKNIIGTDLLTLKFNVIFTAWNHYINRDSVESITVDPAAKYIVKPNFR